MPFYRMPDGNVVHLKFSGKPPAHCVATFELDGRRMRCRCIGTYTCDHELEGGGLCNAAICPTHVFQIARNRHLCPIHRAQRAQTQPELFA